MKKVTLFVAGAFLALSFASCKKTYHCECTVLGTTVKGSSFEAKKKDADASCTTTVSGASCKAVAE